MKQLVTTIFLLFINSAFAQKSQCSCLNDQEMKADIKCDTTILTNNTKLYWQFNCDSVWLTLENTNGVRKIIDEVPVELYSYTYRLGYHLIKEFNKGVLFRSGCPATGPCIYTLIDKFNGNKLKEFPQLISIDTDIHIDGSYSYKFDFIVFFSDTSDDLILYYIDTDVSCKIPFKEKLTGVIPEYQFDKMTLTDNTLTISYIDDNNTNKLLTVNLNDKYNCR